MDFPRDLVMTGVIFGAAAFIWAGWAHERPPGGWIWRAVLVLLQVAGLVQVGFGIPIAIRNWNTPTTLGSNGPALVGYTVVFWLEIIVCVALAVLFTRTKRTHLIAPMVLSIVGVHFVPLSFVFGQPIMIVAGVLITAAGVAALFVPRRAAAPSFWCGLLAAPVFVVLGAVSLIAGAGALSG